MAPLFSKVDSNKLWHDIQHEENVICATFGKDLFNISKVIGRKKVAQFFFDSQCRWFYAAATILDAILNFTPSIRDPDCPPKFILLI